MENLNDVEFGSDKSGEEAPILVAQRYLNIFRQVHIFNKAKRDEFDNELLALPQNITDFFKRMPGGRLLVEHIENVKTERGIAFVKANREDFDEGAGKTDTPGMVSGGVVQAVSGNITIDASFADALAQALANAFKQLPQSPISSAAAPSAITADFGNAFDIIAEEIRTSRASLLDVLKETRSITDSVIASQVSISRILEGILATRDRDDTDIADLNNRIIASQASITKLLEGLYTASNKKNAEISEYLNIENRLQRFREEISGDLDISLQKMQELFRLCAQSLQDRKLIIETRSSATDTKTSVQTVSNANDVRFSDKNDSVAKPLEDALKTQISDEDNSIKSSTASVSSSSLSENIVHRPDEDDFLSENIGDISEFQGNLSESRRKKKKKKRNRDGVFADEHPDRAFDPHSSAGNTPLDIEDNFNVSDRLRTDASSYAPSAVPPFDGVIRNKAFKHEDNFDNIRLDIPPLDSDNVSLDAHAENYPDKNRYSSSETNVFDESFSRENTQSTSSDYSSRLVSSPNAQIHDDLDFVLPEIGNAVSSSRNQQDFSNIGHISNIDSENVLDDDLDFALPATVFADNNDTSAEVSHSMGFEDISAPSNNDLGKGDISDEFDDDEFDDDLDFPLPHTDLNQESKKNDETDFSSSNNSFSTDLSVSEMDKVNLSNKEANVTSSDYSSGENINSNTLINQSGNDGIYTDSPSINIDMIDDIDMREQSSQKQLSQELEQNISPLDTFMSENLNQYSASFEQQNSQKGNDVDENGAPSLDTFVGENSNQYSTSVEQQNSQKGDDVDENGTPSLDTFVGENSNQYSVSVEKQNSQKGDDVDENGAPSLDTFVGEDTPQYSASVEQQNSQKGDDVDENGAHSLDTFLDEDTSQYSASIEQQNSTKGDNVDENRVPSLDTFLGEDIPQHSASVEQQNSTKGDNVDENEAPSLDTFMAGNNEIESSEIQNVDNSLNSNISSENESLSDVSEQPSHQSAQSRYSAELDKIRQALTADNIDIASLDQPIELDDYSDDENVGKDSYDDILSTDSKSSGTSSSATSNTELSNVPSQQNNVSNSGDEDWEWEYVDENGNQISENNDDQDWEWEYVEDDSDENNSNVNAANSKLDDNKK